MRLNLFCILAVIFSFSCKKDSGSELFINLESELEISLSQDVDESGSFPIINISAIDSIDCLNSKLVINPVFKNQDMEFQIDGITVENNVCLIGNKKLFTNFKLNKQDHFLIFNIKNFSKSKGLFTYNTRESKLSFQNNEGLKLKLGEILNIEPNTFWGSIIGTSDQISQFKSILNQNTNSLDKPQFGNYGNFEYNEYFVKPHNDQPDFFLKDSDFNFYNKYTNWSNLKSEIQNFIKNNPSAKIFIRNFQNQVINN